MTTTPQAQRRALGSFWHDLPREGRLLLSIVVVEFLGTGLVLPFHVVYLNEVRDFALSDVGLLLALPPLAGFVLTGPGGILIDRFGARVMLIGTQVLLIAGNLVLVFADTLVLAAAGLALSGVAFGIAWPAVQSLIASVVPTAQRQRYFGVNFALLNLGIGIGGIAGGFLVDIDRTVTFQAIYRPTQPATCRPSLLLLGPLRHVAGRAGARPGVTGGAGRLPGRAATAGGGAGDGTRVRRSLRRLRPAQHRHAGLRPGGRRRLDPGPRLRVRRQHAVIVVLQLFVLQPHRGLAPHPRDRRDGRGLGRVVAAAGRLRLVSGTVGATLLVAGCASVFALGETLLQPTIPALVNDLAPDHLRGRYNALSSASFSLPGIIAPVIGRLPHRPRPRRGLHRPAGRRLAGRRRDRGAGGSSRSCRPGSTACTWRTTPTSAGPGPGVALGDPGPGRADRLSDAAADAGAARRRGRRPAPCFQ